MREKSVWQRIVLELVSASECTQASTMASNVNAAEAVLVDES